MEVGTKEDTYYYSIYLSIYPSYILYIPPSDYTVQLSLAKWSWPTSGFIGRLTIKPTL